MGNFFCKQKYTWILLIGALAVYFFMRFFFGITLPFLLAFLVIWKLHPFLDRLAEKTHLKETWILGIFMFLIVFAILGILYVPISNCFKDVNENIYLHAYETNRNSMIYRLSRHKSICHQSLGLKAYSKRH